MPERRRRLRILIIHSILLPTILILLYFFTLAPKQWEGVDEAVVAKIAREHGREPKKPLLGSGEGDILLFAFLLAGAVGGFGAGYWWRMLTAEKGEQKKKPAGEA